VAGASGWYDAHAPDLVRRYEAINPANLYSWLSGLLPNEPCTVLDIGAGSGRDAGWFAAQGYDVVAVEPSTRMRSEAERLHPDPRIRWINDQLPDLTVVGPLAISFDVVMLSIKPTETPQLAADKKKLILSAYHVPGGDEGVHGLVGDLENIHKITDTVGFRYKYDPNTQLINHPAGLMVLDKFLP